MRIVAGISLVAATLSGVAFDLVLSTLRGSPPATGRNYAIQFAAWAFAWAPDRGSSRAERATR